MSDVDLGLIVDDPPGPGDAAPIEAVAEAEKTKSCVLQSRLSGFWGRPRRFVGSRREAGSRRWIAWI